jgi:hypothetical protein
MSLTHQQKKKRNAKYQARWREKRDALMRNHPDAIERALRQEVERNDMSDQERIALADRLADLAMDFQRRAIRLSKMAREVRTGGGHNQRGRRAMSEKTGKKVTTEKQPAAAKSDAFRQGCLAIGLSSSEIAHILKDEPEGSASKQTS